MPTTTTTYSFNKPVVGADEDDWGGYLNGNWDSVDDLLDGTTPVTGIDINSGTLDGVTIGGTTAGAGTFTTLTANTSITGTLATAAQTNITSVGTLTGLTVSGSTSLAGASTSADITFGDNDKAIFGAGSDLQIYHDGSHSYVSDQGTGSLFIQGTDLVLENSAGANYLTATSGDAVRVFHNANLKLATTSTGIDVTGTVTADGLTVEGSDFVLANFERTAAGGGTAVQITNGDDNAWQISSGGDETYALRYLASGGSAVKYFQASSGGDISFYEDTGTTAKFFWDASAESLGIGTTSPTNPITISSNGGSTAPIRLIDSQASGRNWYINNGFPSVGYFALYDGTAAATRMVIDTSGNVGIGTSSPSSYAKLHVDGGSGNNSQLFVTTTDNADVAAVVIAHDEGLQGGLTLSSDKTNGVAKITTNNSSFFPLVFEVRGSDGTNERMRIDSSGNLLVGQTSVNSNSTGHGFLAGNTAYHTRAGNTLILNRLTSDGDIVQFRKDGTTVGSIGVAGRPYFANNAGDSIMVGDNGLLPKTNTGTTQDGVMNLGGSSDRWNDLYLSGGVYLGGTGSANKLDDYEEGTWTPTAIGDTGSATLSDASGKYVKIGGLVHITCEVDVSNVNTATGNVYIGGLPFTVANVLSPTSIEASVAVGYWTGFSTAINSLSAAATAGQTYCALYGLTSSTATGKTTITWTHFGAGEIRLTLTYRA